MSSIKRVYYGFRYYSGHGTTWNNTPYIAGDLQAFKTRKELEAWIDREQRTAPCGCDGGERVVVSRKEAVKMAGVDGVERAREWTLDED
jgi:hypothetical protein